MITGTAPDRPGTAPEGESPATPEKMGVPPPLPGRQDSIRKPARGTVELLHPRVLLFALEMDPAVIHLGLKPPLVVDVDAVAAKIQPESLAQLCQKM